MLLVVVAVLEEEEEEEEEDKGRKRRRVRPVHRCLCGRAPVPRLGPNTSVEFTLLRSAGDEYLLTGNRETKMNSQTETKIESIS